METVSEWFMLQVIRVYSYQPGTSVLYAERVLYELCGQVCEDESAYHNATPGTLANAANKCSGWLSIGKLNSMIWANSCTVWLVTVHNNIMYIQCNAM